MKTKNISLVLVLLTVLTLMGCDKASLPAATQNNPTESYLVANVEQGEVHGERNRGIIQYKGLPYAAPPVGQLRWRAPQPPAKYASPLTANQYGNRCMQPPEFKEYPSAPVAFTQEQSEDCLYLNIYRPNNTDAKLPVMVWLPGGGLVAGSGSTPTNWGGNLAKKGVVEVSINYRLGRFGFFAHPELSAQNPDDGRLYNYGLMDQIAALQWVQSNIAAFGGDPDNVTIFGLSAGGASVLALLSAAPAKGLFAKAISQSGYGLRVQGKIARLAAPDEEPVEQIGLAIAKRMEMPEATLKELRAQPAEKIVKATNFAQFVWFAVDGVVLPDTLADVLAKGELTKVPLMLGSTDGESIQTPSNVQRMALKKYMSDDVIQQMVSDYGSESQLETFMLSDFSFHSQNRAIAKGQIRLATPVFTFRFGMPRMGVQTVELNGENVYGSAHGSDMPYTFGNFTGDHGEPQEPDLRQRQVSEQIIQYWTNFAKNGDPNGPQLPQWPEAKNDMIMRFTPAETAASADTWAPRLDKINKLTGLN